MSKIDSRLFVQKLGVKIFSEATYVSVGFSWKYKYRPD